MNEDEYNSQIEKIASLIVEDKISFDEQNPDKLQKYYDFVKTNFKLEDEAVTQLVNEAFLYLKLKTSSDVDPLQEGDKFGAGFS
jgi:predicted Abi (CAAX) family protease